MGCYNDAWFERPRRPEDLGAVAHALHRPEAASQRRSTADSDERTSRATRMAVSVAMRSLGQREKVAQDDGTVRIGVIVAFRMELHPEHGPVPTLDRLDR